MVVRASPLFAALLLSGCDAWPTTVDNRAAHTIHFQWHHRDYQEWSAAVPLLAGRATRLALDHYAMDFVGLRIREDGHIYALPAASIARLHKFCSRTRLERLLNLGGDCWLTYHGSGWLSVSRRAAPDIANEESGNEG
jgi:hypothetical protein